jgi:hypothetical protein
MIAASRPTSRNLVRESLVPSRDTPLTRLIQSLRFGDDRAYLLHDFRKEEWPRLLDLADRAHLTLPLGVRRLEYLPNTVRARISRNLGRNADRYRRAIEEVERVAEVLESQGIDFAVLKGITHDSWFNDDPRRRPQYDLDIFCPQNAREAYQALARLGYEPLRARPLPTDHLPTLIRRTGWRWREDYYDPEMPFAVEIHFRLWDEETEGFAPADLTQQFWERRTRRALGSLTLTTLDQSDSLTYATWHLVRHLLRGDLRIYHVYEIAHFLERATDQHAFWMRWTQRDEGTSRVIEAIAFRLAVEWFGCRLNPKPQAFVDDLPRPIQRWFDLFALSPALALEASNKDELLLHLCLVTERSARYRILRRRLLPLAIPRYHADPHAEQKPGLLSKPKILARRVLFAVGRITHHLRAMAPLAHSAWRFWRSLPRLDSRKSHTSRR